MPGLVCAYGSIMSIWELGKCVQWIAKLNLTERQNVLRTGKKVRCFARLQNVIYLLQMRKKKNIHRYIQTTGTCSYLIKRCTHHLPLWSDCSLYISVCHNIMSHNICLSMSQSQTHTLPVLYSRVCLGQTCESSTGNEIVWEKETLCGWLTEQERGGFLPEDEEEGGLQGERKTDRHVNVSRPWQGQCQKYHQSLFNWFELSFCKWCL